LKWHIESMTKTATKHPPSKPRARYTATIGGVTVKLARPAGKPKLPAKTIRAAVMRYRAAERT
jgi:hypothetical protein